MSPPDPAPETVCAVLSVYCWYNTGRFLHTSASDHGTVTSPLPDKLCIRNKTMLVTDWETHTVCAQIRLTWRDVPHLFSAQPAAQTCRLWSWWLQRGWPGPDRPPRWPHWTASERKTAAVNCQTPARSASGSASTAAPSLDEQRERKKIRWGQNHADRMGGSALQ